ncbi:hypothetical protein SAMN02910265_02740 [Ruminococcus flavefaciens]|uniref:Dockerin domain-containing protein n=1 Tax=Ruminococcus flavefaciens TaxID=1265 RepID=A0A1H6KUP5_RUMFL|nr:dockerin type I repeat-containing protein [Ruminococcus flavefaciens]SEH79430.1 hypothetical protein SAMN02910265_02740 [Ruminococcus flavefaciens]
MKKKFMSIMLAATCLASASLSDGIAAYAADSTASAVTVKGDANCDGEVDMSDIVLIMQALANPNKYGESGTAESHLTAQGKVNADMDGDGLTVGDAQAIQKMLLGITDSTVSSKPLPTQRIVLNYESFCKPGETLKVDAAMGDSYSYHEECGGYPTFDTPGHAEYGINACDLGTYKKIDNSPLIINGEKSEYKKVYTKDDMKSLDISRKYDDYASYHHETAEIDFSNYEIGSSGNIDFHFYWIYDEKNPYDASSKYSGMSTIIGFYVGEKAIAIGASADDAKLRYIAEYGAQSDVQSSLGDIVSIRTPYDPAMSNWSGIGILLEFDSPEYDISLEAADGHFTYWDTKAGSGPIKNMGTTYEIGKNGYIFWTPDDLRYPENYETAITVKGTNGDKSVELGKIYVTQGEGSKLTASLEMPDTSPLTPVTQPIGVKSLNDAVITIANYDLKDYDEHYHDSYKQMFASFKNEGYIYHFTEKYGAEKIQLNGMTLMPRMSYEDIGIIYNVNYKGKKYQICYYLNDSDYASASFREYFDSRLGFKVAKTIDDMYIILDNGKNDISAFFSIDSSHYCKVRTFDTEADLTGLLNVLDCEKVSLEKDITPSEPTTIGFNSYEEYTKYIEENDLANTIVTYDQLTQYGKFVQFSINSHWMYDNTFSLFYIFNDGSGKTYDLIINDRPHYSEDYLAYQKLTDVQINKSDMRNADTDADNAYYEFDDKLYIYTKGKLSQIKWFDDKHVYILTGNPLLADYPNVNNTYMAKLLDLNSSDIDNSEYLIGNESVSSAASTTQKLVLNCNSFCEKGEVLAVDMAMGDILSRQKYSDYDSEGYPNSGHHEYSIMATENYKKIDDERLLINGEKSEYTKEFTKEDMRTLDISPNIGCYDLYYHETAEIDFSDYETGSTGCITFRFGWKADEENSLNTPSDFTGMEQTMYFYVGENGVGISNNGREAAQIAYEAKSDDDIMFYDSIYVKWNGKEVMSNLYEKLRKPSDEVLAINFKLSMSPDYNFVYKGKKLSEYANANNSEYMTKLRDLMGYGPTLKYGEMVYTTGAPNGMKWTQEWYEDRVEYFGEELLSKYIVDGEFLEEELRLDINELMKENRIANDEAEKAYYRYIANEAVKQLDKQGIRYEYMNDPKRLVIYVTSEEFKALSLDNVARYGLDISVANGLGVDAIT